MDSVFNRVFVRLIRMLFDRAFERESGRVFDRVGLEVGLFRVSCGQSVVGSLAYGITFLD